MATIQELLDLAYQIRDAEQNGENTALRVGQFLAELVTHFNTKADVDNISGAYHLKQQQAPIMALMSVQQMSDSDGQDNKAWWSTDGHIKYQHNGRICDLGTPAYMLYYCGDKIYKWTGSGFREIGGGGTFASGEAVSNMSIFDDGGDTEDKSSAQLAAMIPSGEVIRSLLDIISSIETSGGSYDGVDLITTFSYDAPTRVITVKQNGRQAKTILLPIANSTNAGMMSSEDKLKLVSLQNLIGKTVKSFNKSTGENGIIIKLTTYDDTPYTVLIPNSETDPSTLAGKADKHVAADILTPSQWPRVMLYNIKSMWGIGGTPPDYASIPVGSIYLDDSDDPPYRRLFYKKTLEGTSQRIDLGAPQENTIYCHATTGKLYRWIPTQNGNDGTFQQISQVNLDNYYNKQQVDNAISEMEATIEQQQLTVITGGKLSLWLDEDGESINIIAGDVPDIAATPRITSALVSDDPSSADNGKVRVTIATTEQGATIYYTTDGSTPTQQSSVYSSPIVLDTAGQHTINAIAIVADKLPSSVATAQVTVAVCTTPRITVNNSGNVNAVVIASARIGENVILTVGGNTATGEGSVSVTIARTSSPQTLSASASVTAAGKLPASTTQSVVIDAKESFSFGAHEIGGKALSLNSTIVVTANGVANAIVEEYDGEIYWHADLQDKITKVGDSYRLYNQGASNSSIFTTGADQILTIEHIPEEVTSLFSGNMFNGCTALTLFKTKYAAGTIPQLADISTAFKGRTSITYVQLPESVTSLMDAFAGCTALETVIAPGVTQLKYGSSGVFNGCSSLESVEFDELTSIGQNTFNGCTKLELDDIDFSQVTSFGNNSFAGCLRLTRFAFKEGITKVPYGCFNGCSNLDTVGIPSTLTTIEQNGFGSCTKLLSIDLPAGFTTFGYNAFGSSGVNSSNGMITIRKEATSTSEVPTRANTNEFSDTSAIYVHANSVDVYKEAWSNRAAKIQAIPTE